MRCGLIKQLMSKVHMSSPALRLRRRACMHCPMLSVTSGVLPPPCPAGHYHAALCCFELAHCTVDATPGCYSMAEVEGLLQRGDEHYKLVKVRRGRR